MEQLLKEAIGIVLQNHPQDPDSEHHILELARKFDVSLVLRASGAFNQLHNGMIVTIDPARGLVFKGEVTSEDEMMSTS